MPGIDGWLNGLNAGPLALSLAGAATALIVVGAVLAWRRANGRVLLPLGALLLAGLAVAMLIDRLGLAQQAAERRALLARAAALDRAALAPGSALSCLDAGAGEAVQDACEKAVFASPQAAATAVAYMSARLQLLQDAAPIAGDPQVKAALAGSRRAFELDRYGVAAEVLARRDGCRPARCPAFALFGNSNVLKANLKAQAFNQYVSRYVSAWNAAAKAPAVAQTPAVQPLTAGPMAAATPDMPPVKRNEHWDFPSADSIPPVNIMSPEPPPPRTATNGNAPAAAAKPPLPRKRRGEAKPPLSLSGSGH